MAPLHPLGPAVPGAGGWRRRGLLLAPLTLACGLVAAPAAGEGDAYARLLPTHVRPGTIAGIRLHAVDYRAMKADPDYARALADLAAARPEARPEPDRFAFWVNAYNLLAIKAVLDQYPVASIRDGGSLLRSIWKKPVGTVDRREYSLQPRRHRARHLAQALPRAARALRHRLRLPLLPGSAAGALPFRHARRPARRGRSGCRPPARGRVSSIFKWFRDDFDGAGGVAAFIKARAGPAVAARVAGLTEAGLTYLDYDWSLNDTARVR